MIPRSPADLVADARCKAANDALLKALHHPSDLHGRTLMAVRQALDDGADPNVLPRKTEHGKGFRPLHVAVDRGVPLDVVALLIERGAEVSAALPNGETPLHVAARHNRIGMVDALLAAGADLHARTKAGHTPLGTALLTFGPVPPVVEHLMTCGASLDELTGSEPHPLHHAVAQLNVNVVNFLLDHGVSPNTPDNHGSLPMSKLRGSLACQTTEAWSQIHADAIVARLIEAGADLNAPQPRGPAKPPCRTCSRRRTFRSRW